MPFEDISGQRIMSTDYLGGTIAAASGNLAGANRGMVMDQAYTIRGIAVGAGTTPPAGTTMIMKVWVNGVRKGLATVTLTAGAGAQVSFASGLTYTGPANSVVALSVHTVGATAGTGARYQIRYHHGWSR